MQRLKSFVITTALAIAGFLSVGFAPLAAAYSLQEGVNAARGADQPSELIGSGGVITTVTNVLLFIVGALAVIMIIIGGLRYAVSGGNSSSITAAKNTILYAIVGLIVAFLAFAIINFVISSIGITDGGDAGFTNV